MSTVEVSKDDVEFFREVFVRATQGLSDNTKPEHIRYYMGTVAIASKKALDACPEDIVSTLDLRKTYIKCDA